MKLDRYELKGGRLPKTFEFTSVGPKGKIPKLIKFVETGIPNVFNLEFGNKKKGNKIDDMAIANNGDVEKILSTVANAIYHFTDNFPDSVIHISGSTESRTRLYRMAITKYFIEIKKDFYLHGFCEDIWESLVKGKNYEAYLIKRKN